MRNRLGMSPTGAGPHLKHPNSRVHQEGALRIAIIGDIQICCTLFVPSERTVVGTRGVLGDTGATI
jgi:hypothetical protein